MPFPTYVDSPEGRLALVCEACLAATVEDGETLCAACVLGGDDEDPVAGRPGSQPGARPEAAGAAEGVASQG